MVAVFCGMLISAFLIGILFVGQVEQIIVIELIVMYLTCFLLWKKLKKYGEKRYKEIEV